MSAPEPSAELLHLSVELVPGFTTEHRDAALLMLTRRNRELHTGDPAFEDLPLGAWLADYYRVVQALLKPQNLTLADLIGIDEAVAAEQMIDALDERVKKTVFDLIAGAKRAWNRQPAEDRRAKRAAARAQLRAAMTKSGRCPACETGVRIGGEQVVISQTRLDSGKELVEEVRMLPTSLECAACGLRLTRHAELTQRASEGSSRCCAKWTRRVPLNRDRRLRGPEPVHRDSGRTRVRGRVVHAPSA